MVVKWLSGIMYLSKPAELQSTWKAIQQPAAFAATPDTSCVAVRSCSHMPA